MASTRGTGGTSGGIEARIAGLLPSLTAAQRRVAEIVLADPAAVVDTTISALAGRAGTSLTTVTRLCRSLDLAGFPQLKLALATEAGRRDRPWSQAMSGDIGPYDDVDTVLHRLVQADVRALQDTARGVDRAAAARVAAAMAEARRVVLVAVSGSGALAGEFALRLHRIDRPADAWQDVHDALTGAALLGQADVLIGLSHSGQTAEVVEPLREAGRRGALTVAITNHPQSTLAHAATEVLVTASRESTFRSGGPAARHAQLLVLELLYLLLAQRTYADTTAALRATDAAVQRHTAQRRRNGN